MIHILKSESELKNVGAKGDFAIIGGSLTTKYYKWMYGCWRSDDDYVCPVTTNDLFNEPNA